MDASFLELVGTGPGGVAGGGPAGQVPRPVQPSDTARNFLVVNHAHKGAVIEAFIFNADTNEKMTVTLSPQNAGQLGMILIEASLKELGHR
jgi:hypothetical protein